MIFDQIELDYEVEENARDDIKEFIVQGSAEMNPFQHAFIAGLIKKYKPQKMVEIGIAAGGTTCFLHECAKRYQYCPKIFSVDKFETYYRVPTKKTGYLIDEMSKCIGYEDINEYQNTLIGNSIPFVIDQIKKDIDFLILDTTHSLPGELLDFLICLPYLKIGAVVVLHDTICNLLNRNGSFATKLLYDVVKAKKICNFNILEEKFTKLPNIMAFEVTEDTLANVKDILSALTIDWQYCLESNEIEEYAKIINTYYGQDYKEFFLGIVSINTRNLLLKQISQYFKDEGLVQRWKKINAPVLIYGNGFWASKIFRFAMLEDLEVKAMIISDDRDIDKEIKRKVPIYKISEIPNELTKLKIIYAMDIKHKKQIEYSVQRKGLEFV